jgi:imidazolonepropionase-like amidohydrolase
MFSMRIFTTALLVACFALSVSSQGQGGGADQQFIRVRSKMVVLKNVRIINGTGGPAKENQTIVLIGDRIGSIMPAESAPTPADAQVLDLSGYTVIPGLVGMHNHMFFPQGGQPAHYSNKGAFTPVMRELTGVEDARKMVNFWADQGATSFKAYMNITRAELRAVVEEAHKRKLKVTGHLCSVGYKEAAEIGIDNLEHGLLANSEYAPDKKPDECPQGATGSLLLDINGPQVQETIRVLVEKKVAITSTLPVFEAMAPIAQNGIGSASALLNQRMLNTMSEDARLRYLSSRSRTPATSPMATLIRKWMDFERAFVKAGGLLMTGLDPTGNGGIVAGFGDLRGVELLVEAGFTPEEAIKIATYSGALFLGEESRIGTVASGRIADLVVIKGNPAAKISEINNVEIVFKNGIGYDTEKLIQSVQGLVGTR